MCALRIAAQGNAGQQYGNMVGKVVQTTEGYFFKKKYARKYGYRLDDLDLLEIYWNMPKVESVLEVCHA